MLIKLLGPRCVSLATAVVQVRLPIVVYDSDEISNDSVQIYMSEPTHHHRWNKRSCGVCCFVKDNGRRSYFLRVFDMDRHMLVFEQEIYNQFRYKTPREYFHTFEADECQVGLNFADEGEAAYFHKIVDNKLTERRQRKERRNAMKRQSSMGNSSNSSAAVHQQAPLPPPPPPPANATATGLNGFPISQQVGHFGLASRVMGAQHGVSSKQVPMIPSHPTPATSSKPGKKKKGDGKGRKLKKEDISLPTNFQHISHVGWDPNRGFDLENVDPKLKQFFSKAGVSERELADKETRDFIYDFIDKHGGLEAAIQEVRRDDLGDKILFLTHATVIFYLL